MNGLEKTAPIPLETLERLEWSGVQALIARFVRTEMGAARISEFVPHSTWAEVDRAQRRVAEMRRVLAEDGRLPIVAVDDPASVLHSLGIAGRCLSGEQIYRALALLLMARSVASALRRLDIDAMPTLAGEWARLPEMESVISVIDGNISAGGHVEDHASAELMRIRTEIRRQREGLEKTLQDLVRADWTDPVLRDDYITIRNDRFVLPVRADTPRRLHGIVHGTSSTEKTLFVEPIETVEINNRIVELRNAEDREVESILNRYSEVLRCRKDDLQETIDVIADLDRLTAMAEWADAADACAPELVDGAGIQLRGARHPLLEESLSQTRRRLVPLNVDIDRDVRALVISGPNAGGKTVALKTLGIVILMAHAGLPVPAESARLPRINGMLADIGDEQSIENSLSTFSSHVRNLGHMVETASSGDVMLIDEIGTGTDPSEGAALGMAVLEDLMAAGALVIATTHHQALKTWAYRHAKAQNAAFDFDDATLEPTYRLLPGVAGASIGLTMAGQLGLPERVIDRARTILDPAGVEAANALDSVRHLASELTRERSENAARRRRLEEEISEMKADLARKREEMDERYAARIEQLNEEFRKDARKMVSKLEDALDRRALDKQKIRAEHELARKYSEKARTDLVSKPSDDWLPQPGERVFVASLGKEGSVRKISKQKAEVALGRAVFTVPTGELRPMQQEASTKSAPIKRGPVALSRGVEANLSVREVPRHLSLLGLRVDSALSTLDRYLDDAVLMDYEEVRIAHGVGTGRLRDAVRAYLDDHPEVARWRQAKQEEGGAGATIVTLAANITTHR